MSTRTSRCGNITVRCPKYNLETEGGRTFLISTTKLWNSIPKDIRCSTSTNAFKKNYRNYIKEGYAGIDRFPIHNFLHYFLFRLFLLRQPAFSCLTFPFF